MTSCKFCNIINGRRNGEEVIYENDNFLVLADKFRKTSAGIISLIIPKEHNPNILEVKNGEELLLVLQSISKASQKAFNCKGIRIWTAINKEAGQSIFHCHIHVVPCNSIKDRFIANFPGIYDILNRFSFSKRMLLTAQIVKYSDQLRSELSSEQADKNQ
ncbi:MAG: HIT family protein [Chloroflexia bacterium]|nr:HIT family protein [Chloroflexia bacterium]